MTIGKCDRCNQTSDIFYVYGNKKTELCLCPRCNKRLRRVNKEYYANNRFDSKLPTNLKFMLSPKEKEEITSKRDGYKWKNEAKAFAFIKAHPWCSAKEIAKATGNSRRTVIIHLARHIKTGVLTRKRNVVGDARANLYFYIGDDDDKK